MSNFLTMLVNKNFRFQSMASLKLWLDASDKESFIVQNGSISKWYDKSGNDNHAEQPSADERPQFNADDEISFDGKNDKLLIKSADSLTDLFAGGGTVIAVIMSRSLGGGHGGRIIENTQGQGGWQIFDTGLNGDKYNFQFTQIFNDVHGTWQTNMQPAKLLEKGLLWIEYDSCKTDNKPDILYDDEGPVSLREVSKPVGIAESDRNNVFRIGNNVSNIRGFDGVMLTIMMFDKILHYHERIAVTKLINSLYFRTNREDYMD